jgi:viroplasmin and RNaseH domain-containing protein
VGHCLRKLFAPGSKDLALLSELLSELESLLDDVEKPGNDEEAAIRERVPFYFQKVRESSMIGFGEATMHVKHDHQIDCERIKSVFDENDLHAERLLSWACALAGLLRKER